MGTLAVTASGQTDKKHAESGDKQVCARLVCVCVTQRESVCVCVCVCVWVSAREGISPEV